MKLMFVWVVLLATVTSTRAEDAEERFVVDSKEAKRVVGVLNYSTHHPQLTAEAWSVFFPVPPELSRQSRVKSTQSPDGKVLKEKGPGGRNVIHATIVSQSDQKNELKVQLSIEATLHERHLRILPTEEKAPPVAELSQAERKRFLAELGPIDCMRASFKVWLVSEKFMKEPKETEIAFARRVFLAIKSRGKYEFKTEMNRTASMVCRSFESDCCGLSVLFVAIMRANQIPARTLIGRWAESANEGEKLQGVAYYQTHVKAEFHLVGMGWVPVDISSAIVHDKKRDGLSYFGHDAGDFITFHIDPHFEVDTRLFGVKSFPALQGPQWWVRGGGDVKPSTITETWVVKAAK